ncbi:MAG: WYL domain-containing protein [Chloroflexi bacterium]|nr:WYL domain-containing protein [Chloroflexota bacterium]
MGSQALPAGGKDNQIRRTARVLEIIQQIAVAPGQWSRQTLSEYHEVSERMIQKDLELIRYRLGLPLLHDGAGYSFERLPHLPTTTYSFAEALALLTAARAAQALPGVNSVELAAAIARLESIFPDKLRPVLREATEQLPRRAVKAHRQAMLTLLHRALVERCQVQMSYATGSREGEVNRRVAEPYHLMPYGRSWHLIAYDHQRRDVLQFKVDRVQEAELLETTYTIPGHFDLDEYLGDGWGLMRGSAREPEEVMLLFEPEAGRWVAEEYWHKSQRSEILADGRFKLSFYVGVTPEMVNWLLYYGASVWVERPEWLCEKVREAHREALQREA